MNGGQEQVKWCEVFAGWFRCFGGEAAGRTGQVIVRVWVMVRFRTFSGIVVQLTSNDRACKAEVDNFFR